MEVPEPWCGIRYDRRAAEEGEEELTLTPHHTPSQSFDFIVWEKAYLDSLCVHGPPPPPTSMCVHRPSAGPSLDPATPTMCVHIGPFEPASLHKESLVPSPSTTLMAACRTDADLPPSFIDYKLRSSDAGFTSLEEAVRSYALRHPHAAMGSPSLTTERCSPRATAAAATSRDTAPPQFNANHDVLLRRSYSQPGGGAISRGFCIKPTSKNMSSLAAPGSAVFNGHGGSRIYQEQIDAEPVAVPPVRNRAKMFCFPTSPGRRKRGQSALHDHVDPSTQPTESPTLDVHLQRQQEKLRSPAWGFARSPAAGVDAMYMRTAGGQPHPVGVQGMPYMESMAAARNFSQSSFSDMSSSDCDHHHPRDAAAAFNISKLKLWRLHHRFKAFCRKLCSACTI